MTGNRAKKDSARMSGVETRRGEGDGRMRCFIKLDAPFAGMASLPKSKEALMQFG